MALSAYRTHSTFHIDDAYAHAHAHTRTYAKSPAPIIRNRDMSRNQGQGHGHAHRHGGQGQGYGQGMDVDLDNTSTSGPKSGPILLPPPSSLEGYRPLPPYTQPPPQRWETKSGSSSSANLPSLPSIHSMSRSSSPTTMLPTPVSLPSTNINASSYFPRDQNQLDRDYAAVGMQMRERELREREMLARGDHGRHASTSSRYSPRVKYERSLSPPLHMQVPMHGHSGMPMSMPPPVDPRYYPAHPYRDHGADAAARAVEEKEHSVGQTRRLAHLMSEQKRRESINTGFASLRAALPTCHPTDSKAVVLRKAVARIQQLEQLIGPESSPRHSHSDKRNQHAQYSVSPEMSTLPTPDLGRSSGNNTGRYNDWEEKPQYDDYPRSHGRPHSQSLSQPHPPRRQHSHSHSHSELIAYPRSPSGSVNGEAKRGRDHHWQDESMGNRQRLS